QLLFLFSFLTLFTPVLSSDHIRSTGCEKCVTVIYGYKVNTHSIESIRRARSQLMGRCRRNDIAKYRCLSLMKDPHNIRLIQASFTDPDSNPHLACMKIGMCEEKDWDIFQSRDHIQNSAKDSNVLLENGLADPPTTDLLPGVEEIDNHSDSEELVKDTIVKSLSENAVENDQETAIEWPLDKKEELKSNTEVETTTRFGREIITRDRSDFSRPLAAFVIKSHNIYTLPVPCLIVLVVTLLF
ncbi:hypothetical protein PFISCL1PPCAC_26908, partial [Pristionchus fissidentatus]